MSETVMKFVLRFHISEIDTTPDSQWIVYVSDHRDEPKTYIRYFYEGEIL